MKLMAPIIEDTPARCREKIVNSIDTHGTEAVSEASGGYIVHPTAAPKSM